MKSKFLIILLTLISVQSAKILGIFPFGRSHYILARALMRGLADRGHDVTVISAVGEKEPPKNGTYRDIVPKDFVKDMEETFSTMNMFDMEDRNIVVSVFFLHVMMSQWSEKILKQPEVQDLINSDEKFDIVIVEQFANDGLKALALHFGVPLISFSTLIANPWLNELVANPAPISYIPGLNSGYSITMSFKERVVNTLHRLAQIICCHLYLYPSQNRMIKNYIPNNPNLYDILYNVSLTFVNAHPSYTQAVPNVPNMINIGGFHIQPPKKLPRDLQAYLDNAKEGVVYFSMGSNLKSTNIPSEKLDAISKSFGKLKQKVLWKWENDVLPGKPDNVKIGKWFPQADILAHPNVKLFITHGGLLSTTETIHYGVPILSIPIYGDQKNNAKIAADQGIGLTLPYQDLNEDSLSRSLGEVLENPIYVKAVKLRSQLFHDRPVKPLDEAVYWVEYVIRHNGAPNLRVAGVDLSWYKYHLLDVFAFLILFSTSLLYLIFVMIRGIFHKRYTRKHEDEKKQKTH